MEKMARNMRGYKLNSKNIAMSHRIPKTFVCLKCGAAVQSKSRAVPDGWFETSEGVYCHECKTRQKSWKF